MNPPRPRFWRLFDSAPIRQGLRLVWESGRGWTVLQVTLLVAQGAVPVLALYLTKALVDVVTAALAGGSRDLGRAALLVGLAAGIAFLGVALRLVSGLVAEVQSIRLSDRVQDVLHQKSVELDLQYYESSEYHDTLHRAQAEAPHRPARIVGDLSQIGLGAVSLLGMMGLLVSFDWVLVAVLLGAALPSMAVKASFSQRLYRWAHRQTLAQRLSRYLNTVLTSVDFAKEIRLFGLGQVFQDRFQVLRRSVNEDKLRLVTGRIGFDLAAQVIAIGAVFGSVYLIVRRALNGSMTVGDVVIYMVAFQRTQDFFRDLLSGFAGLYEHNLFLSDFRKFTELRPTVVEPAPPKPFPRPLRRGVSFDHVTFRYPGTEIDILKAVSFEIHPGEHVALVGENGSGKTTLVKLLCRLYDPTAGAIRVDGIDLREFAIADVRAGTTVLFQDYARYQLSARDNIWLGNVALPTDSPRIVEAARQTNADSVIAGLPEGYDTLLGRQFGGGTDLSIGQWQRLALARAFVRDAELIVLDEPTAALDPLAEAEVFDRFHELARGRTAILISHRLSTVKRADRILVLVDGAIAEAGAHEELLGRAGVYAHLFETQAKPYR